MITGSELPEQVSDLFEKEPDIARLRAAYALMSVSPKQAISDLEALAHQGSLMSMVYIANAYRKGVGVPIDLLKYEHWLKQARDRGSSFAAYQLGRLYLRNREFVLAEESLRLSATMGFLPSIALLGLEYSRGIGIPANLGEARELLEAAHARGHLYGTKFLARLLLSGKFGFFERLRGALLYALWPMRVFKFAYRKRREEHPLRYLDEQFH